MLEKLPGWILSNEQSVRREAAAYRDMTPEERLALVAVACEDVASILEMHQDPLRALEFEDRLPASTRRALARMRC